MNSKFVDIKDPLFLEFYGALIGDDWIGIYNKKNNLKSYIIGFSGHSENDYDYLSVRIRSIVKNLFNRDGFIKHKSNQKAIEYIVGHKELVTFLNEKLNFPIGLKKNIIIHKKIYNMGFSKVKYIIKGLFDTDGSFYFDKTPVENPYPWISITVKSPKLIKQIKDILLKEGFKVIHYKHRTPIEEIKLKGRKQLSKWLSEIGSSNSRHTNKIARVAQLG